MNILQINTVDFRGGAAQVAYNLKLYYEKQEIETSLLVKDRIMNDKNVFLTNNRFNLGSLSRFSKKVFKKDIPSFIVFKTQDIIRLIIANDINFFNCNIIETKEFQDADVIHCHNLHGNFFNLNLLSEISKVKPVVWTLHDMWSLTGHCSYSSACEKWQNGCGNCSDLKIYPPLLWDNTKNLWAKKKEIYEKSRLNIVVPSLWLKKKTEKSILKNQNIELIYNGIDVKELRQYGKEIAREKLGLPENKKIIMFLAAGGKKEERKGWRYVKEIVKKYPEVLFLCIGGKESNEGKQTNVKYIQYIDSKNELAKYFSASDLFLFTSLEENFSLVILEAMACGTPIVSFDVGGVKEAVTHRKNGYITKRKDVNDLKNGIDYIFNLSENGIKKISKNSIEKVRNNFSLKIMANEYLKLYKNILL